MQTKIVFLFLSLFTLFGVEAFNDSTAIDRLSRFVDNQQAYHYNFPQEKVYLHFDNTGYFGGETIWFKAYVVTAEDHRLTHLSRILYVELLTPSGAVVAERKLKIENGQCHGDFSLDRMIRPGYYEVRAYTRYMLNFGDEVIFSRVFPILNPDDPGEIDQEDNDEDKLGNQDIHSPFLDKLRKQPKPEKRDKLNVHFYPEGGNLIQSLPTRVAFQATDSEGRSVAIEGTLFHSKKAPLQKVSSVHQGRGVFDFTADSNDSYLEVKQGNKTYKFPLPGALKTGYQMNLFRINEKTQEVRLRKTPGLPSDTLGLVISSRGRAVRFETLDTSSFPETLILEDKDFPEGVNRLTLFDTKGEILSDRLFFIHKEAPSRLIVTPDKASYRAYEKIRLDMQLTGVESAHNSYSLSVRDAGEEPLSGYDHLRSNLLLSSELRGYIESPDYYFERHDAEHTQALDLLLMVQGWRRYCWEESIHNQSKAMPHYVEKQILVKGRILSKERLPQDSVDVTIEMIGADSILYGGHYLTDREGNFIFPAGDFEGRKDLLLITDKGGEPADTRITLDRQISPDARTYPFLEIEHSGLFKPCLPKADSISQSILDLQRLSSVTIKGKKIRRPIVYDVAKEVSYYRDLGLDMPYWSGHTYLQYRNKCYARGDTDNLSIPYEGTPGAVTGFRQRGIWREETDQTMNVNKSLIFRQIEEIEQINIIFSGEVMRYFKESWPELFPKKYILILTTPFERPIEFYKGTRYTHIQGYSKVQEFYQPDYEKTPPIKGEIDYRRTLYWNPDVIPDTQGHVSIEFFNNSSAKELIVNMEGVTGNREMVSHKVRVKS